MKLVLLLLLLTCGHTTLAEASWWTDWLSGSSTVEGSESNQEQSLPIKSLTHSDLAILARRDSREESDFNQTLSSILVPRVPGTESHASVKQYIKQSFQSLGWTIQEDSFTANVPHPMRTLPFTNIIATSNPLACRRLVLACHYDSKYFANKVFLGAIDSAVPCSIMIHLARVLDGAIKQRNLKAPTQTTLQMIFFDGEEAFKDWSETDSLYGSRHLARVWSGTPIESTDGCRDRNTVSQIDRIQLFVLLDLLGTQNPKIPSFFPVTDDMYSRLYYLEKNLNSGGLMTTKSGRKTSYFTGRRAFGGIDDDHKPFLEKGVKVLHLIPTPFPKVWHTLDDNASALDYTTIRNLIVLLKAFLVEYLHLDIRSTSG